MKYLLKKKVWAYLLCLVLITSYLFPFSHNSQSTSEAATLYYNTGIRDKIATSLSSDAITYYQGTYSPATLKSLSGSSLKSKLYTLMSSTMSSSVSYKSLTTYWPYSDAENGQAGTVLFYSDEDSSSFNREHVWPKSRASFYQTNGGSDLHHLRPANATVNSTRGNHTMADLNHSGTTVSYNGKVVGWYNTSTDTFEPLDNVKGDVARIFLYVYVRWQQPNLYQDVSSANLPAFDSDDSANDGQAVIESLDTLLEWMAEDPVDTWEMSRNDIIEDIQGNRNVFIDYPELAWKLFGRSVPSNLVTPSDNSGSGSTTPTATPTVPSTNQQYKLVTSINELSSGGKFVIVGVNGSYTGALNNTLSSGRMGSTSISISNNIITNPSSSIVWKFTKTSTANQYSIYNEAIGKYLVISANTTSGFDLVSSPSYYFNASSASAKATNAIYLSTTATGKRNISIYQTDFRPYATSSYKPMYLYKLAN